MIWRIIILLFLVVVSSACSNDNRTKVKIVNLEGKSRSIATRTPDLNLQALQQQGNNERSNIVIVNDKNSESYFSRFTKKITPKKSAEVVAVSSDNIKDNTEKSSNDFGNFSSNAINKSFAGQDNQLPKSVQPQPQEDLQLAQEVNYDLSTSIPKEQDRADNVKEESKPTTSYVLDTKDLEKNKVNSPIKPKVTKKGKYFVQVGSFSRYENAKNSLKYMSKFHSGEINTIDRDEGKIHRVVLGPFVKRSDAGKVIKNIKSSGKQAILVIK